MNVYDFDKTIYDGDCTEDFIKYCLQRKPSLLKYSFKIGFNFLRWQTHTLAKDKFKETVYLILQDIPDIDAWIADFWYRNAYKVKPFYLKQQKKDDVVISASPEFLINYICQQLKIVSFASKVDRHTGKYEGVNCYGQEKVRRFYEAYPQGEIDQFYSDSYSDEPLAKLAKEAYIVQKNKLILWDFNR